MAVEVTLEKDVLTLEGRVGSERPSGMAATLTEFGQGDYRRIFILSTEVDRERISAEVADGVLKLVLPKAEPARAKRIVVKAG